ncbi:hypothetical protein HE1_00823 [Holospora elegans E1]|uniref:Uncharacterized protein n=1 Tax=Holospora elegans E1 TaxID=1427503 RepID=A0A023DZI3_9PROT|nr:hypothetical protein HE1_00823 [Holospora elegans E1]
MQIRPINKKYKAFVSSIKDRILGVKKNLIFILKNIFKKII